jgi:hypothetical protein
MLLKELKLKAVLKHKVDKFRDVACVFENP